MGPISHAQQQEHTSWMTAGAASHLQTHEWYLVPKVIINKYSYLSETFLFSLTNLLRETQPIC